MSEANDIRGVLLAALQMGEWEAEHLTGLQLARRLAAIHLATADRLSALSYQCQALAVEKQELLSGEASRLAERVAGLEAENARLRRELDAACVSQIDAELSERRMWAALCLAWRLAGEADAKIMHDAPMSASAHLDELRAAVRLVLGGHVPAAPDAAERELRQQARPACLAGAAVTDDAGEA